MLGAPGIVDAIAGAEIIEAVGTGRMLAPGQQERVDESLAREQAFAGTLELGIEKAEVEDRVMGNQRRVADERDQLVGDLGEAWLVPEELVRKPVHRERLGRVHRVRD